MTSNVTDKNSQEYMEMIKACYEDGEAEINGRKYCFTSTTHQKRKAVFAYFSTLSNKVDISWIDSKEFERIQAIIDNIVTFNGELLSRRNHWEKVEYAEDFVILYSTAMGVISYPFLPGKPQS